MITFANNSMIPSLKSLWKESFGDSDKYIDFYFNNRYKDENTLVWVEDDIPVSMITMLPATIRIDDSFYNIKYIYAVATLKKYRGNGFSTKLLSYANKMLFDKGEFSVLVPSSNSLFDFYAKCGYVKSFFIKQISHIPKNKDFLDKITILDITADRYKVLRDSYFKNNHYIKWDLQAINYAIEENNFIGGDTCEIIYKQNHAAIMYYVNNNVLYIRETTLCDDDFYYVSEYLAKDKNCNKIVAKLTVDSNLITSKTAFAMSSKPLICKNGYFNLALD